MSAAISREEVAEQLRKAVRGELTVALAEPQYGAWNERGGDVAFTFGVWTIWFFNDCDEMDYVDSARAPGGRVGAFADWTTSEGGWENPLDMLDADEQHALEELLRAAR